MKLDEKQIELDLVKWQKSERLGFDACGSFNYCYHCDKSKSHPCARACFTMDGVEYEEEIVVAQAPIIETKAEEIPAKKEETAPKATKKTTTKTATKKTTSKSTTKKTATKKATTKKTK